MTDAIRDADAVFDVVYDCTSSDKEFIQGKMACVRNGSEFVGRWVTLWELLDDMSWAVRKDGPRADARIAFRWVLAHQPQRTLSQV